MMNQINFPRSALTLLASVALHCAGLLTLLVIVAGEPANRETLQGKMSVLTIHMVSASSSEFSPDVAAEHQQPETEAEDPLPPLPVNDRALRHPHATRPKSQTAPPQKNTSTRPAASPFTSPSAMVQSANRGHDKQESEEGIAAQTSQRSMIGSGDDENAVFAARLRSEIESHKRYPLRAKHALTSGIVKVRFNVGDDGSLTDPQVVSSSGNRDLDNAALQAVRQSNAIGHRPPGFGRSAIVNIRFSLRSG